jgi:signal transduction histidine kinase
MERQPPILHLVRDPHAVGHAMETLAALERQAAALRLDVAALRAELASLERELMSAPGTLLREAREKLVAAALDVRHMKADAADAQRRQMTFLATVAHELRNPLMPLRLAALMLDRARTDDVEHARLQATIKDQVAQIARLVGDLLDGSRMSTGRFRLERTMIDIVPVLQRSAENCRPAIDERGQHLECILPPGPVLLLGDAMRLAQVFGNLLDNSCKYTPEGGRITLRATVGPDLRVSVADTGIGITRDALPRLFDMFARDAHAAVMDHGGLGIGLAVVRELVKAHEGTVEARSAGEQQGSEFIVSLPMPVTEPKTTHQDTP